MSSLLQSLLRRRRDARSEDGFVLLESLMAISLITIVMASLASFTMNALTTTNELRSRQAAAQIASTTMATLRAIPATDLITGRDPNSVTAQFSAASAAVQPALATMTKVNDPSAVAGAGANAAVPTSATTLVLNSITYQVNTYLGSCVRPVTGATSCVASGSGITYLRAVVAVTWSNIGCPTATCTYVSATLVSADDDPVFNTNHAQPPSAPIVDGPGNQISTLGGPVSLQLTIQSGTGVGTVTWQVTSGTLPAGLTLAASGLVSGTPTTKITNTPITVTATDAFGRPGSASFTWSVVDPPTITTPALQTTTEDKPTSLAIASTCPNSPCTFTLANPPPGLSINASTGVISGSPTTVGTYANVKVTITDDAGVAVTTAAFTWKVVPAPTITWPGTLTATVTNVKSVPISYTCPTATCTLTLTGTVPGLGLSTTTPNTTNNTTTTLAVSTPSGTVYIAGTVQASAVPTGTSATYAPQMRITDGIGTNANSATGTWVVYAKPTIGSPGTRAMTITAAENVAIAYTCPSGPCTITLANTVPGLGLSTTSGATATNNTTSLTVSATSGTVYLNGTVGSGAVPSGNSKVFAPTLTISDSTAVTGTSAGAWTAYLAPTITNPGNQAIEPTRNFSLQMSASCPNGGCSYQAEIRLGSGAYSAMTISSTGLLTRTNVAAGSYTVRVTVTDADGVTAVTTFNLTVQTFSLTIPDQSSTRPATGTKIVTFNIAALVSPPAGAGAYSYALTGAPSWLSINTSTGLLTATLTPSSTTDNSITVTVTSSASASSTVADSFRWTIS